MSHLRAWIARNIVADGPTDQSFLDRADRH